MEKHQLWAIAGKAFRGPQHEDKQPTDERLLDAITLINNAFEAADLEYIRAELWLWLKAIFSNKPWSFRGSPSIVIQLEDIFRDLITGGHQILQIAEEEGIKIKIDNFPPFSEQQIEIDRQYIIHLPLVIEKYNGAIRRLTLEETRK